MEQHVTKMSLKCSECDTRFEWAVSLPDLVETVAKKMMDVRCPKCGGNIGYVIKIK